MSGPLRMFGIVNVVRCCCDGARTGGGGFVRLVVAVVVAVVLGVVGYRYLGAALTGVQESTAAANRAVGVGVAVVLVVAALTAGGLLLIGRRRQVRQAPQIEAHDARMRLALEAQRRGQIEAARTDVPATVRAVATRVDKGIER